MLPPISSTMFLLIDRPSPVPLTVRSRVVSICLNGWNKRPMSSRLMPMPVSEMSKRSSFSLTVSRNDTSPSAVNLTAFPRIFTNTCRKRTSSAMMQSGIRPSISKAKDSAFSAAR
ncbi:MAG: hypothetical protein LUE17_08285 [Planctomycetaceae bacterium]|nr:hypothetical protein [Planctomycetaceae bacterium]